MRSHGPVINTDHVTAAERAVSVFHTDCTAPFFFLFHAIVFFSLLGLLHFLVAFWSNCLFFFVLYLFICHVFKRILRGQPFFLFLLLQERFLNPLQYLFVCLVTRHSVKAPTGGRTGYVIFFYLNQIFCITAPSGVTMHCKI